MPTAPPATPRKMLPPPMTTATSTPMRTTSATSSTIRTMVARLIPKASSPMSASPDSLSRMRLWAGWAGMGTGLLEAMGPEFNGLLVETAAREPSPGRPSCAGRSSGLLGGGHLGCHFGGEVVGLLLDALAHDVQRESLHLRVGGLQHLFDRLLVVLHERLVQQRDFLQVLLDRTLDHPGGDVGRLAGFGGLGGGDIALLLDQVGGHVGGRQRHRLHRGHMHGDVLGGDLVAR